MEDENETSMLDTSHKMAQITIEDKKIPLNDVTNTPSKVKTEVKKVKNTDDPGTDNSPSEDDQVRYNKLITKAKKYTGEGMIRKAMELNREALKICYSEKLAKKVSKMETYLKDYGEGESESEEDNGIINVGNGFHLYKELYDKLYRHQKEGVLWMWSLFKKRKGGILGDDMGLGKTIQVISFLSGMFDMEKIHYVLIVMPVALVVNWENEFNKWAPGINVTAYHGSSKRERERSLAKVQRRGGVLITTYGMVVTSWEQLGVKDGRGFSWDYMILDEGHKIKNPTKTTKGVYNIPARNRLILTGTPVQNNLKELWALFDFAHHGTLLGTARTFKMEFENPITRSREKDATINEKKLGQEMSEALKKIMAPFFLRRTKAEVQAKKNERSEGNEKEQRKSAQMPNLTRKNELVIWLYLTQTQQKIYQDFLELDDIKELLMTTKSPLVALTVLKKICDHPRLLSTRACAQLGLDGHDELDEDMLEAPEALESAATKIQHVEDHILIQESGKLIVLVELLDNLKSEGHRCLVFSQSKKMLDIIQKLVTNRGHKIMRLDGSISQIAEREERIQKFQNDDRYSVFLLTTQVGGVGLTLTAADRVVIYDPSWNPATDAQAVDRVFRIGQDKNVVIYRLITCGTVEEKIYRRQIFKDSITRQTTGNSKNPYRYFTKQDLKELFTLENPRSSTTQIQLQDMHTTDRRSDVQLDAHIAFLHTLEMFGVSDHDLMFSQEVPHEEEEDGDPSYQSGNTNRAAGENADYIQSRIQRAQQLIEMESSQPPDMNDRFNEKKTTTFQSGERTMPVWKPKPPPSSYSQLDERPRIPDKNTIDLTRVTSPVQPTSPSSPIEIDDEEEVQDVKPPVTETNSVKAEVKEEQSDGNIQLDFGLDDLKDEPASDYLESSVKTEVSNNSEENANQSINSASDLEIFENNSSEQKTNSDHSEEDHKSSEKKNNVPCDNEINDSNIDSEKATNKQIQNEVASPFKIPDIPTSSPFLKKTPKQKHRIIEEELIISPDAGSPLVSFQKANVPVRVRLSGSSKKLNMSLVSPSPESPLTKSSPPTSSELQTTIVENSPDCSFETVKAMKKESQSPKINKVGPVCNIMDFKSPEQNKAEETVVEDSIFDSEDELSDSESPVSTKRTSYQHKNAIESSDDEDMIPTKTTGRKQRIVDTEDEDEASQNESNADEDESEADEDESEADKNESEADEKENVATENRDSDNKDEAEDLGSEDEFVENEDEIDEEDVVDVDDDVVSDGDGVELDEDDDEDDDRDYGGSFIDDVDYDSEGGSEDEESEDEGDGFDDLPEDLKLKFNECVNSCRVQYKAKNYEEALAFVLQGLEIFPDPELQQQALKIHKKINK